MSRDSLHRNRSRYAVAVKSFVVHSSCSTGGCMASLPLRPVRLVDAVIRPVLQDGRKGLHRLPFPASLIRAAAPAG